MCAKLRLVAAHEHSYGRAREARIAPNSRPLLSSRLIIPRSLMPDGHEVEAIVHLACLAERFRPPISHCA